MNELRGKYINLVLGVEEARNMDFLQHPVYILANFNGRTMESDLVNPSARPDFNTELVWETEKKVVRNVRSTNAPLRVECYTINEKMSKECFGFVLLSLRSAHIVPATKDIEIPLKWYKLIGVKSSYKKFNPELKLSLSLRDSVLHTCVPPAFKIFESNVKEEVKGDEIEKEIDVIKYNEDGYIKLGKNDESEKYELKIVIKMINNLDLLLTEKEIFQPNEENFYLTLKLFGIDVKTKSFDKEISREEVCINENVVVKFQSNLDDLKSFFQRFKQFSIEFCHGSNSLGSSIIDLNGFIPNTLPFEEFLSIFSGFIKKESIYYFKPYDNNGVKQSNSKIRESKSDIKQDTKNERKPQILIELILNLEDKTLLKSADDSKIDLAGCGDGFTMNSSLQSVNLTSQISLKSSQNSIKTSQNLSPNQLHMSQNQLNISQNQLNMPQNQLNTSQNQLNTSQTQLNTSQISLKSPRNVSKSLQTSPKPSQHNLVLKDFQQFSLDIILQNLTLNQHQSTSLNFMFKHPKATTFILVNTLVNTDETILDNINCKVIYVSTKNDIVDLIKSWKPKLLIKNVLGNTFCDEILIDIDSDWKERLENEGKVFMDDLKTIDLKRNGSIVGELKVLIYLQECTGFHFGSVENELKPRILDEILIVKELNDLMVWKSEMKESYLKDLKLKEKQEVDILVKNWIERKNELESKLIFNVNRCKKLAKDLKKSTNKVKIENLIKLKQKSTSLEDIHEEIRKNAVKYSLTDNYELIEKISNLEIENEHLKNILAEQSCEMDQMQKSSLSNEQTANLLQDVRNLEEKYMEVLKVKNYFKEQYAKAAKEIHELKEEGRRNITSQLMIKKEELSQLSLDKFFDLKNGDVLEYSDKFLDEEEIENEFRKGENNDRIGFDAKNDVNDV